MAALHPPNPEAVLSAAEALDAVSFLLTCILPDTPGVSQFKLGKIMPCNSE